MVERSIKKLSELDARVYVHLPTAEIAEQFMRDAEDEGFTFGDGVKPTEREADSVMAVNGNGTLNFVGFAGHMAFGSGATRLGNKLLLRVDYSKYKAGEAEYLCVKDESVQQERHQEDGLNWEYFPSGNVRRIAVRWEDINGYAKDLGFEFYESGAIRFAGILQRGGLYQGREYYPSGGLKFAGQCNEREAGGYYGPPYPVEGKFFSGDGKLLYDGRFHVVRQGGVGYPKVTLPEGFGSLK